jgi:hypothetical protein
MKRRAILIFTVSVFLFITGTVSAGLTDNLVAYYPFSGNADDQSGNGYDGTVYGATLTSDRFGNPGSAYSFDGIDDYISVDYTNAFQLPEITISVWVQAATDLTSSTTASAIVTRGEDFNTDHSSYTLVVAYPASPYAQGLAVHYEDDDDIQYSYGTGVYPDVGAWTHIIVSRAADGELNIYNDGVLIGQWLSTPEPSADSFQDLIIGAYWYVPTPTTGYLNNFFNGNIDDVMIFDTALTPNDIAAFSMPTNAVPVPGALLLGSLGVGCVTWLRKRRTLI